MATVKTNAMRVLEKEGVAYQVYSYESHGEAVDGVTVAALISRPVENVYKTLVTQGASRAYFVFVIPVQNELDVKKAAKIVGEKSLQMIPVNDINNVTGYVRGGCSPIGMKKQYPITLDARAKRLDTLIVSAGKIGMQIEVNVSDLQKLTGLSMADVLRSGAFEQSGEK